MSPSHSEGWNGPKKWFHAMSSLAAAFSAIMNLQKHPVSLLWDFMPQLTCSVSHFFRSWELLKWLRDVLPLWNLKVSYIEHWDPPLHSVLSQLSPIHPMSLYFPTIYFNTVLQFAAGFPKYDPTEFSRCLSFSTCLLQAPLMASFLTWSS
jgi:hypothetical protein